MSRSPARIEADVIHAASMFADEVFESDRSGQAHPLAFACQAFSHSLLQKGYSENDIESALQASTGFPVDAEELHRRQQIALIARADRAVDRSLGGKLGEALTLLGTLSVVLSLGVGAAAIATAVMERQDAALFWIAVGMFGVGLIVAFLAGLLRRGLSRRAIGRLGTLDEAVTN